MLTTAKSMASVVSAVTKLQVGVYWRRRIMDAAQPAATQHIENRESVMCVGSSIAPDAKQFINGGLGYGSTDQNCQGSRYSP